jgi:hypothetical protein
MDKHHTYTHVISMPHNIHGFSRPNLDGSFSIYLNTNDCCEQQRQTYDHEIAHIENGDYDNLGIIVDLLEVERY